MKKNHLTCFFLLTTLYIQSQPLNDKCSDAFRIDNPSDFCSEGFGFSNAGATPDAIAINSCLGNVENGVWFTFVARKPGVRISLYGKNDAGGSMQGPRIQMMENCDKLITCSLSNNISFDELYFDELLLGQTYNILISSIAGGEGSFKICITDFVPIEPPQGDCDKAIILCDKSSFVVSDFQGIGTNNNEVDELSCLQAEFQSSWYKWTCSKSGPLTFTIIPGNIQNMITDDLDFAVYELPQGIDDCVNKKLVRCVAAGELFGFPFSDWKKCNGPTGLSASDTDMIEAAGCASNNNNFVSALNMVEGKSYALIINNFTQSGFGYSITFGGQGDFKGPIVEFDAMQLDSFECDKRILFQIKSVASSSTNINYTWQFGTGSNPQSSNEKDPPLVSYNSAGIKTCALSIESPNGCKVTKLLNFFVNPCKNDTTTQIPEVHKFPDQVFNIFPNPVVDIARITVSSPGTLYIFNVLGQMTNKQDVIEGDHLLNMSAFDKGIYYVSFLSKDGNVLNRLIFRE